MRIALALASWVVGLVVVMATVSADRERGRSGSSTGRSRGLGLLQIRDVMRAHATEFAACHRAATRGRAQLHGPFLYQIGVDRTGRVISARPYQPSAVATFDKCVIGVIKRARFPGGPANVEAPIVFEPG
jgi:hypothetical protein